MFMNAFLPNYLKFALVCMWSPPLRVKGSWIHQLINNLRNSHGLLLSKSTPNNLDTNGHSMYKVDII